MSLQPFWPLERRQSCQFMSETTNDVVLEAQKSAKFGKCRKSFLCRFWDFYVVFMSFCHFHDFGPILPKKHTIFISKIQKKFCLTAERAAFCSVIYTTTLKAQLKKSVWKEEYKFQAFYLEVFLQLKPTRDGGLHTYNVHSTFFISNSLLNSGSDCLIFPWK